MSVRELISEYQHTAALAVDAFEAAVGVRNPVRAWASGLIPQVGVCGRELRYRIHGIGCEFIGPNFSVDIEFGPEFPPFGFDAWRLAKFSRFLNLNYELNFLSTELHRLMNDGTLIRNSGQPTHLFFLNDRLTHE